MAGSTGNGGARGGNALRIAVWGGAVALLLLPLIAMQFTREVAWDGTDFAIFGAMLAVACGAFEMAVRLSGNRAYRLGAGVAVATAFLLVWANLAVGFIGDEGNPANLMFAGVLAIGFVGAVFAGFKPRGMAWAMIATAAAQALVAVIAVSTGMDIPLVPTAIFVALWLGSAWLFQTAARG